MENEEIKNYHKKIYSKLMADYLKMAETGKGVFNFNNTKFVDDLYEEVKQGDLFTINFTRDLMHFYNYIEKRPDKANSIYTYLKENNSYYYIFSAETVKKEYCYARDLMFKAFDAMKESGYIGKEENDVLEHVKNRLMLSGAKSSVKIYSNVDKWFEVFHKTQNEREAKYRLTHKKLENEDSTKSTSEETMSEKNQVERQEYIIELKKLMKIDADFKRNIPDKDIIQTIK